MLGSTFYMDNILYLLPTTQSPHSGCTSRNDTAQLPSYRNYPVSPNIPPSPLFHTVLVHRIIDATLMAPNAGISIYGRRVTNLYPQKRLYE